MIGGDGSLTGADIFRQEWKSLLDELVVSKDITTEDCQQYHYLNIVGMVSNSYFERKNFLWKEMLLVSWFWQLFFITRSMQSRHLPKLIPTKCINFTAKLTAKVCSYREITNSA